MLIGLHGRKQAGKDTVFARASHLMDDVVRVERASFADKLYASAAASLGVPVSALQAWKTNPEFRVLVAGPNQDSAVRVGQVYASQTIREYLQGYGTEAHRQVFGDSFWVDQVGLEDHEGRIVLVTDVRFANEAEVVRDAGGFVVNVVGPPEVEAAGDGHASEVPLPPRLIDFQIDNDVRDDGFQKLDAQVAQLLRALLPEAA